MTTPAPATTSNTSSPVALKTVCFAVVVNYSPETAWLSSEEELAKFLERFIASHTKNVTTGPLPIVTVTRGRA